MPAIIQQIVHTQLLNNDLITNFATPKIFSLVPQYCSVRAAKIKLSLLCILTLTVLVYNRLRYSSMDAPKSGIDHIYLNNEKL